MTFSGKMLVFRCLFFLFFVSWCVCGDLWFLLPTPGVSGRYPVLPVNFFLAVASEVLLSNLPEDLI